MGRLDKFFPDMTVRMSCGGAYLELDPGCVLDRPVRFIICDGDVVEEKNLVRQNFTPADLGENKAKVLAERYSTVFGMETEYVPAYVRPELQKRKTTRRNAA